MMALVKVLALLAGQSGPTGCADQDHFTFRVERARPGAVEGLEVQVEAGGPRGVSLAVDTVKAGHVRVCIRGGAPGELVEVRLAPARGRVFQLLYPPGGRLPITHQASPTIVVCEVEKDCDLLTMEEAVRLIKRAKPTTVSLGAEDKESLFRQWRDHLKNQGMERGELVEALRRKERQVAAARAASELLSRFGTRAKEAVERFRRYGPDALDHPSAGPITQINDAIASYNPVFNEMNERADSYRKATADAWGKKRSTEFQALIDDALAIHTRIYSLNELGQLITDCRHGWKTCPDRKAARSRVLDGAGRIAVEVDAQLLSFGQRRKAFLEDLNEELFEAPPKGDAFGGSVVQ
jgi:hypothetical protein